jgi:hypothetical protein
MAELNIACDVYAHQALLVCLSVGCSLFKFTQNASQKQKSKTML